MKVKIQNQIIEFEPKWSEPYEWIAVDQNGIISLFTDKPTFYGNEWIEGDETNDVMEILDETFKGKITKAWQMVYQLEDVKVPEEPKSQTFQETFEELVKSEVTMQKPAYKKLTAQDVFDTFDTIDPDSGLIYSIMKAVMDGLRGDNKLPEIDLVKGSYTSIEWRPDMKKSGNASLLFEKCEDHIEIAFFLRSMIVKYNLYDNCTRVECVLLGMSGLESIFEPDKVSEEYKQFAVYLAKAIPTLALLNF